MRKSAKNEMKEVCLIFAGVFLFFFVLLPTIGGWLYEITAR